MILNLCGHDGLFQSYKVHKLSIMVRTLVRVAWYPHFENDDLDQLPYVCGGEKHGVL